MLFPPAALPTPSSQLHGNELGLPLPQHPFAPRLQNILFRYAELVEVAVRDKGLGDGCPSHPHHHQLQQRCCDPAVALAAEARGVVVELGSGGWVGCWVQPVELNLVCCLVGCHRLRYLTSVGLLAVVGQDWGVVVLDYWH